MLQSFLELKDGEENFIADVLAVTDMLALAAQDEWSEGSVICIDLRRKICRYPGRDGLNFKFKCKCKGYVITKNI